MSRGTMNPETRRTAEQILTRRQLEVLDHWLNGQSTRTIALGLDIAEATARGHLDRALQKMRPHLRKDAA